MHYFMHDQAEQIRMARDVLLNERRVESHNALGINASRDAAFVRLHSLDEGRDETISTEGTPKYFSNGL